MSTIDWPDGKKASLGATPRVISGVNASDGYLVDPVARHTLIVARKFLDKSSSTMGHQGIRTGSVKRHVALSENRLGISNTRPPKFLLSSYRCCVRSPLLRDNKNNIFDPVSGLQASSPSRVTRSEVEDYVFRLFSSLGRYFFVVAF